MNCEEFQAQLLEYFEKSLETPNLEIIETHLATCLVCRVEAENLKECIRQVASLPLVDPPIGFTQRVMAHVVEVEKIPGLWHRLFLPFHIKIPIQATAAVLIGICAVYLLPKEQAHKQALPTSELAIAIGTKTDPAQTPAHQGLLSKTEQEKANSTAKVQETPAGPQRIPDTNAPLSSRKEAGTPQDRRGDAAKDISPQVNARGGRGETFTASKPISVSEQRRESNVASAPTIEPRLRSSGIISTTPIINTGIGPSQFPGPSEFESSSLRPGSVSIEPFADYELVFRFRAPTRSQARRDNLDDSRKQETAGVAPRSAAPGAIERLLEAIADNAGSQTVWLSVPKKEYEQLKRDLRAVGAIESELLVPLLRKESISEGDGQLQIKLTVLPAMETNRIAPAAPNER